MSSSTNQLDNIVSVSSTVAILPSQTSLTLSGGREIAVRRLSWLQFEALWGELSELLAAVLSAEDGLAPEELASKLAGAPAFVLKLCALSTGLTEAELAAWAYDDVLAVSAAALRFSFIDSAGVRDFFGALAALAQPAAVQPGAAQEALLPGKARRSSTR